MKISRESILISPWKNIYSGTTCRRLKMSGRLDHFCKKINFAAEPEFMAELEIGRNANSKGPTSFSKTSSWQRIHVFFNTAESIINKWKSTLLWWRLAMLALCCVLSKRNEDMWMQREEEGIRKRSEATLWSTHLEEAFLLWKNSTWRK